MASFDGFAVGLLIMYVIFVVLFGTSTLYGGTASGPYTMFMHIHIMAFMGYGAINAFIAGGGFAATGLSLVIAAVSVLWYLLVNGFFEQVLLPVITFSKPNLGRDTLVRADFAAASVLISLGAVIGRARSLDALIMAIVHIVIYTINETIGRFQFPISDFGGSMTIHLFGAVFGLVVSIFLGRKNATLPIVGVPTYSATSNVLSLFGTLFIFCYFPSFNCYFANSRYLTQCVDNTYLSILTSVIITVIFSRVINRGRSLVGDVQNSVFSGGVAIAATSSVLMRPFGAIIVGAFAGLLATLFRNYVTPRLEHLGVRDTRSVLSAHAVPGFLGGLIAIIACRSIVLSEYATGGLGAQDVFRGVIFPQSKASAIQLGYLLLSMGMGLIGGILSGVIILLTPVNTRYFSDVSSEGSCLFLH